jgi:hypothetical protein
MTVAMVDHVDDIDSINVVADRDSDLCTPCFDIRDCEAVTKCIYPWWTNWGKYMYACIYKEEWVKRASSADLVGRKRREGGEAYVGVLLALRDS